MKSFEIREQGQVFARVFARTAVSALRKAHRDARRVGSEAYNGYEGLEEWYASGDCERAKAIVRVTPRGTRLVSVESRRSSC